MVFCLNSRTLRALTPQGQWVIYSAFASLEGRRQSYENPRFPLGQPIVADFSWQGWKHV